MTCILIDDEMDCLQLLTSLIEKNCPTLQIIGQYDKPKAGIVAIRSKRPNLVFLDVAMPEIDGFGVLEACRDIPFQLIFTTAFNEYAVSAFKHSAIGYLLKPVDAEDLTETVQRAQKIFTAHQLAQQREILFDFLDPTNPKHEKIAFPTANGIAFVSFDQIIYCEASGNYTNIHRLGQKTPTLFTKSLKSIEELLPSKMFYRIHHSFIINLRQVEQYVRSGRGEVKMSNGVNIPIARDHKQKLLELLDEV